ncbi:MAG: hypothetical protein Q4D56_02280 [Bacteroides sp.]|nr:hypothetical protein [Bacteroides sp.]
MEHHEYRRRVKSILLLICICLGFAQHLFARQHPCIYATPAEKADIRAKIKNEPWAQKAFADIRAEVEGYADRHAEDPEWIVSRMAMYWKDGERYTQCYLKKQNWDRGEGNAPVPTVRMPGMRVWNKYVNVPLEDRTPYNETGDMWGINRHNPSEPPVLIPYKESGHMIRGNNVEILTLAENAAFVYWVTGEEKFARFATDIFNTWLVGTYYMNPILDPEKSCGSAGGWEPGGICGYYDYEQIHDDLAMHAATVYDFAYDYLMQHPHTHLGEIGRDTKTVADEVFKRFVDLGLVRGGKEGNWNVNGWNIMLRPVLVLGDNDEYADGKGRDYYLHYLVEESTDYHNAIPDMLKSYDSVTGLWPEAPGYAFGTVQTLLDWVAPLRRAGIDILAGNPILQKAAMAAFPWMDDASNMVVFGDSRGGSANFRTFEDLLAYYTQTHNTEEGAKMAVALNKAISLGKYHRDETDWMGICTFIPSIPTTQEETSERASYSAHHRFITMKNWNAPYKMMANLYGGTKGSHLTPNGLALQLYAYGYALVPDAAAYESYWAKDYAYHQSPTGANTILPGYTEGEISIQAMEPIVAEGHFTNEYELTPFLNFADVVAAEKRRTVAVVRTSDSSGYYVDIFRSDQPDNDYLFHHVGTSLSLTDVQGRTLPSEPLDSLDKAYHKGYAYFSHLHQTAYADDFVATWQIPEGVTSRLWMTGADGRTLYQADAPATTLNASLTPNGVSTPPAPTPTLIVRQSANNAATHPFVGVYEAYKDNTPTVKQVNHLPVDGNCTALSVETTAGCTDYILSATDAQTYAPVGLRRTAFCGTFGMIRMKDGEPEALYLGNGRCLKVGKYSIETDTDVYAALYRQNGEWHYSATDSVRVKIGKKTITLKEGYNQTLLMR